jgi:hypothetical protein
LSAELTSAIAVIVAAAHQSCLPNSMTCLILRGVMLSVVKNNKAFYEVEITAAPAKRPLSIQWPPD